MWAASATLMVNAPRVLNWQKSLAFRLRIQFAVPVIVIGVPVRYAHTHYGISAYADFDNAVKLACEILKRLDEEQIMSF